MKSLLKLDSFIVPKIWGGFKLNKFKNLGIDSKLGETYEVSTHKSGNSKVLEKPLSDFLDLNYLVKFIDTSDNLSIQVHPNDEYASKFENDKGKLECWVIQDCEEGSGIYLGFKEGVTKKEFKNAIQTNLDISQFLNFIPVHAGDFFELPEGLVHAIGSGITLCEVQQSSGVTYRVWDWNRVDDQGHPRELHIEKAMDVLNFKADFNKKYGNAQKKNLFSEIGMTKLIKHKDFQSELLNISADKRIELNLLKGESLVVLQGELEIEGVETQSYNSYIAVEKCKIEIKTDTQSTLLLTK